MTNTSVGVVFIGRLAMFMKYQQMLDAPSGFAYNKQYSATASINSGSYQDITW